MSSMNSCDFIGRLTSDPTVRYTMGEDSMAVARFSLAIDKPKGDGAYYLNFVAFGSKGEFAEKYLRKGQQIGIHSRATSGSYEKDGSKVYYTEFVCEEFVFCGKKEGNGTNMAAGEESAAPSAGDGFMNVPDGIEDELPFN